jgi:hypothetical protein
MKVEVVSGHSNMGTGNPLSQTQKVWSVLYGARRRERLKKQNITQCLYINSPNWFKITFSGADTSHQGLFVFGNFLIGVQFTLFYKVLDKLWQKISKYFRPILICLNFWKEHMNKSIIFKTNVMWTKEYLSSRRPLLLWDHPAVSLFLTPHFRVIIMCFLGFIVIIIIIYLKDSFS